MTSLRIKLDVARELFQVGITLIAAIPDERSGILTVADLTAQAELRVEDRQDDGIMIGYDQDDADDAVPLTTPISERCHRDDLYRP